ncbi:hypothetical protein BAE44_0018814 [Dichanthelium oligosanthes]|uniref:Uncharacterized protein n=1 Tax=Dichanthelium oligosanthes TaxID=888268 RepID=A0A1E5V4Z0_9POAL|nr:hypothetical protein BAE44_0018814 [Dichanthelium oligosanthes]
MCKHIALICIIVGFLTHSTTSCIPSRHATASASSAVVQFLSTLQAERITSPL